MSANNFATIKTNEPVTVTGSVTLGYLPSETFPSDLVVVNSASHCTVALPNLQLSNPGTGTGLGIGNGQEISVLSIGAGSVAFAAAANNNILGATVTIGQNASVKFKSGDSTSWYRL